MKLTGFTKFEIPSWRFVSFMQLYPRKNIAGRESNLLLRSCLCASVLGAMLNI